MTLMIAIKPNSPAVCGLHFKMALRGSYTCFCDLPVRSRSLPTIRRFVGALHSMESVAEENKNKRMKYEMGETKKIKGKVVLMKKNLVDFTDIKASVVDRFDEIFGNKVSLQLISAVNGDPAKELRGKLGKPAYLEDWITKITNLTASDSTFNVTFDWDEEIGIAGAFIIKNFHHSEFYLKTLTLEDVPGHGRVHFICNSWVYPAKYYKKDRIFFTNQTYLPSETPEPLRWYREEELVNLRGDGTGKLEEWDRVYDYACYNDLADPDKGSKYDRPILGGSTEYPYPRRGRTGLPPAQTGCTLELICLQPVQHHT